MFVGRKISCCTGMVTFYNNFIKQISRILEFYNIL
jgi:hypothetical protein